MNPGGGRRSEGGQSQTLQTNQRSDFDCGVKILPHSNMLWLDALRNKHEKIRRSPNYGLPWLLTRMQRFPSVQPDILVDRKTRYSGQDAHIFIQFPWGGLAVKLMKEQSEQLHCIIFGKFIDVHGLLPNIDDLLMWTCGYFNWLLTGIGIGTSHWGWVQPSTWRDKLGFLASSVEITHWDALRTWHFEHSGSLFHKKGSNVIQRWKESVVYIL